LCAVTLTPASLIEVDRRTDVADNRGMAGRQQIAQELDRLLVFIKETPGLSGSELARRMQLSTQTTRNRLLALRTAGKIRVVHPPGRDKLSVTAIELPASQDATRAAPDVGTNRLATGRRQEIDFQYLLQRVRQFQRENPNLVVTFEARFRG
jgi:hypothetical protein